jgi:hypothetical protein
MEVKILPAGSVVRITSYSPFRGLRGTIRSVHTIPSDPDEPFCFYLIDVEGIQLREPVWFEFHEVEVMTSPLVALETDE